MKKIFERHGIDSYASVSFQHINTFETKSMSKIPLKKKSVLVLIFPYYSKFAFSGNISGYCAVKDYHLVVMEQLKSIIYELQELFPAEEFVPFVDASPIDEVDAAVKAGLGVRGENSLLITPSYGSFVFIGEIVTTLQLDDRLFEEKSCCKCGLCRKMCPGGCIKTTAKGEKITFQQCASFISQKKQELTGEQLAILKKADTVFGCDICQLVCPHNRELLKCSDTDSLFSCPTSSPFIPKNLFTHDILNTVTAENVETVYKSRAFGFRGLKVLKRNLEIYNDPSLQ